MNNHFEQLQLENIQNQLIDVLTPNILLSKQSVLILQMLMEHNEYVRKKGETAASKKSKQRLLELLDCNNELNSIGDKITSLKNHNNSLLNHYKQLLDKNKELQKIIYNTEKAFCGI